MWWVARPSRTGVFHLATGPTAVVARCGQLILGARSRHALPRPICAVCARKAGLAAPRRAA